MAQSRPQPDSPNYGVEVNGCHNAGRSIENVVHNNRGVQQPNDDAAVRIGGNQAAGESINNRPGSANYGVEVRGSQDADKGIANMVRNNHAVEHRGGNYGVRAHGNQKAGEGISNKVTDNVIGKTAEKPPKTAEKKKGALQQRLFTAYWGSYYSIKAQLLQLKPAKCNMLAKGSNCEEAKGFKAFIFFFGLYLVFLGSGCLKFIIISRGADQFSEDNH